MIFEIKEDDRKVLREIFLNIALYNKIYYGFNIKANIINNSSKQEITLEWNGIKL